MIDGVHYGESDLNIGQNILLISGIIGTKAFVARNYQVFKALFSSTHEKRPKTIRGLDGIYSLKRLSENLLQRHKGKKFSPGMGISLTTDQPDYLSPDSL